jgi:hypothetical protein
MAMTVKRTILYDVLSCILVDVYRRSILTDRLRGLIFDLEYGDSTFHRNIGELPQNYTVLHPTRYHSLMLTLPFEESKYFIHTHITLRNDTSTINALYLN